MNDDFTPLHILYGILAILLLIGLNYAIKYGFVKFIHFMQKTYLETKYKIHTQKNTVEKSKKNKVSR